MPQPNNLERPALTPPIFLQEETEIDRGEESFLDQGDRGTCAVVSVLHAMGKEKLKTLAEEVNREHALIPDDMIEGDLLKRERHPLALLLATHLLNEHPRLWPYHGTHSERDSLAAAASTSDIKRWLSEYFPEREVLSYSSYCFGAWDNAKEVNALWSREPKPVVLAFLNGDYLDSDPSTRLPSLIAMMRDRGHCVHITTPFIKLDNENVQFDAFTWGKTRTFTLSKSEFKSMMWEIMVAK